MKKNDEIIWITWTDFINYLQGFYIIATRENITKYDLSNSKENIHCGVPLQ